MANVTCDRSGCSNQFDPSNDEGCTWVEKDGDEIIELFYCCIACLGQDESGA